MGVPGTSIPLPLLGKCAVLCDTRYTIIRVSSDENYNGVCCASVLTLPTGHVCAMHAATSSARQTLTRNSVKIAWARPMVAVPLGPEN